ncbi:Endonuclease Exonuclease Phosphatase [Vibrio sp. B1ASS3]|uniref:hypothetical protein n=1 Tax=Vibrio sp. B1ASS3 TaxID=2751176 RepID=UPI001ABB37AA|nr:hypothetical protein [Vibrio sp. B1ASS3]CAD7820369.1 Endonuclease Exonuclease Phosphatase [Vibrio sp. B1ASS3]CAE6941382.1 Endonuclease Exonuclease Phosphatase [Vibrio sp. B1ASS3]
MKKNKFVLALGLMTASSYSAGALAQQDEGWINQGHSYSFSNRVEMPYTAAATDSAMATIHQSSSGEFRSITVSGKSDFPRVNDDYLLVNGTYQPDRIYSNKSSFIIYDSAKKIAGFWNEKNRSVTPIMLNSIDNIFPGVESIILMSGNKLTEFNTETKTVMDSFSVTKPIRKIYHNGSVGANAWVILFDDGKVKIWGDESFGGKPSDELLAKLDKVSIKDIHVTEKSFIARTDEDKIVAWGGDEAANVPSTAQTMIGTFPVLDIQANKSAVAVSTSFGVFAWGSSECGGDSALEGTLMQYGNYKLDATDCSFIASNNSTGHTFVWGNINQEESFDLNGSNFDIYAAADSYLIRSLEGTPLGSINDEIPAPISSSMYASANETIGVFGDSFVMVENNGVNRYSAWKDGEAILTNLLITNPAGGGISFDNYYLATDGRSDVSYIAVYDAATDAEGVMKSINN